MTKTKLKLNQLNIKSFKTHTKYLKGGDQYPFTGSVCSATFCYDMPADRTPCMSGTGGACNDSACICP